MSSKINESSIVRSKTACVCRYGRFDREITFVCKCEPLVSAQRFHPGISVQPTPSGPIHFSFKVADNQILFTEAIVKEACFEHSWKNRGCGHTTTVCTKHYGRYCGNGFLSFSSVEENVNCMKYVRQRLIEGVVFERQVSDSFNGVHNIRTT